MRVFAQTWEKSDAEQEPVKPAVVGTRRADPWRHPHAPHTASPSATTRLLPSPTPPQTITHEKESPTAPSGPSVVPR